MSPRTPDPNAIRNKPPNERGRPSVNVPRPIYDRLLPYATRHGLLRDGKPSRSQAVGHALAVAESLESASPPVSARPDPVPISSSPDAIPPGLTWSQLHDALAAELGIKSLAMANALNVLRKLGMP